MKSDIIELLHLLIESITKKTYMELIKDIHNIGMEEKMDIIEPFRPFIPKYDKVQEFDYITHNNEYITLTLFEIDNNILEIDFIIKYHLKFLNLLSPGKRIYNKIIESLKKVYGEGYSMISGKKNHIFEIDDIEIEIILDKDRKQKMELITITIDNNKYNIFYPVS